MDKSSRVYVIEELERHGLAERRRSEEDRRSHAVHIAEKGRARLADATAASDKAMAELLTPLTPPEREQLHELLTRFIAYAAEPGNSRGVGRSY